MTYMADKRVRNWGEFDECGARNLIDDAATLRGVSCVRTGQVVGLSVEIKGGTRGPAAPNRAPIQHFMTRDGGDYAAGLEEKLGFGFSDDVVLLPTHGTTHIDALCHIFKDGKMYNGFPASGVTSRGASRCGIDKLQPIVTRAVFVDLGLLCDAAPGYAVSSTDLISAVAKTGIRPEPGDALIVRTGWLQSWRTGRGQPLLSAGLHHDCADWIIDQGFALVAADNPAVEVLPSRELRSAVPLHIRLLHSNGIYFAELLDLDFLATLGRPSFMLSIAPLRIEGGAGSPINPIAVL